MVTQVAGPYAELHTWDNLYTAYRKAAKGKRSRSAAARFEYRLEDNLIGLQDELATETYHPGPYASFTSHEPKRRLISAAPFRDRVVHHALCRVIEPAFEASFIDHAYANRVGKGTHRALDTCQHWAQCYPNSFDHFVNRTLGCPAYLRYVDDILLFGDNKAQLW